MGKASQKYIGFGFRGTVIISPVKKRNSLLERKQYPLGIRVMERSGMFWEN